MRLLIISHTPHHLRDGAVVGWGATVREIDELATLFDSVVHIAPLYPDRAPTSSMPYQSPKVRLRAVSPAGGERLRDKLRIPLRYPGYVKAVLQERRNADVIHVRAPANISLLALVLLWFVTSPRLRWAKYAGDWSRRGGEPLSYRFQRWWLARGLHRGVVTVNGRSPDQSAHVHSFLNPCLTEAEIAEGLIVSQGKTLGQPLQLLFVGRIESAKGADICVEVLAQLRKAAITARLDLIGEGEEKHKFEQKAYDLGVASYVKFHGGLPRDALSRFYERAHFILLPSDTEGWPKVLSEAMAYGVVPIASAVGSIPEYLTDFATGAAIKAREPQLFSGAIETYLRAPDRWQEHSRNAVETAQRFSYLRYLRAVAELLELPAIAERIPA